MAKPNATAELLLPNGYISLESWQTLLPAVNALLYKYQSQVLECRSRTYVGADALCKLATANEEFLAQASDLIYLKSVNREISLTKLAELEPALHRELLNKLHELYTLVFYCNASFEYLISLDPAVRSELVASTHSIDRLKSLCKISVEDLVALTPEKRKILFDNTDRVFELINKKTIDFKKLATLSPLELKTLVEAKPKVSEQTSKTQSPVAPILSPHQQALLDMQVALRVAAKKPYKKEMAMKGEALMNVLDSCLTPLDEKEIDRVLACAVGTLQDPGTVNNLNLLNDYTKLATNHGHWFFALGAIMLAATAALVIVAGCTLSLMSGGAVFLGLAACAAFAVFGGGGIAMMVNDPVVKTVNAITLFKESAVAAARSSEVPVVSLS